MAMVGSAVSRAGTELSPELQELKELRQLVEAQNKQIEALAAQVGKLTRAVEGQKGPEAAAAPAPTTSIEPAKPGTESASAEDAPKTEAAAKTDATAKTDAAPKAELTAGGLKHVVAKGETLTSIAKHYNIAVADLKNANKIENERKLQIGQILAVPTSKTSDSNDKKETP